LKATYCNLRFKIFNFQFTFYNFPKDGFTLLEVMISLAIVAALLTTVLYTVNFHADAAYEHTINTKMLLLAKEKLIEMQQHPAEAKGDIQGTDFTYENLINTTEDTRVIEIKTIIRGHGKEVVLSEFVLNKQGQR